MSTRITQTPKIEEAEIGSVDSRDDSGTSSATERNDSIDPGTKMTAKVQHSGDQQQECTAKSQKDLSLDSTSTRPTSPVPVTQLWESAAHSYVYSEEALAGKAIHISLSRNPLNLQPSKAVPGWTRPIHIALAESSPTIPFQQMYKPLGQEEMGYIRKRLEEYTDLVRRQTHILDNFDNAVILADARTLFSCIALLVSTIKTQRVNPKLIVTEVR
ncbi:uncharacterized protein PADG_02110 [Paracoccidioides brasiliensis Pb18]|uniref:Uncharacterized protein n=2 Tax=Paracoccidioides brasiliensis TaxID=121759 RepID=C1G1U4_PARBD|nr:uncharacterized protein PADG_02110 [Paracoccidioides brasiliensis Pb18]EEH45960.2 hypothetical protein PADG_02110 [Paracoccidioides brasiliensis Pb18]ODH26223.1 hypothetical protein ACO22_04739 [Paracoccidioides brasiliensis]ODH48990.1 hypothetical protein GX48_04923 [Paracoccidioides brasiliensis]